jgi:hypothetical protein
MGISKNQMIEMFPFVDDDELDDFHCYQQSYQQTDEVVIHQPAVEENQVPF